MHGKTSPVHHADVGVFRALPNLLTRNALPPLAIERESLPACLEITAWTDDGEIMGVRHRHWRSRACSFTRNRSHRARSRPVEELPFGARQMTHAFTLQERCRASSNTADIPRRNGVA